jgi:hypothetical protein
MSHPQTLSSPKSRYVLLYFHDRSDHSDSCLPSPVPWPTHNCRHPLHSTGFFLTLFTHLTSSGYACTPTTLDVDSIPRSKCVRRSKSENTLLVHGHSSRAFQHYYISAGVHLLLMNPWCRRPKDKISCRGWRSKCNSAIGGQRSTLGRKFIQLRS